MSQDTQLPLTERIDAEHFLMLAFDPQNLQNTAVLEAELRRMGLRPEALDSSDETLSAGLLVPTWRVHFGSLVALLESTDAVPSGASQASAFRLRVQAQTTFERSDPVAESRELFKLAVLLLDLTSAQHFYWSPADLWTGADNFRAAVAEMLDSGLPPILHLVAFSDEPDGSAIVTRGLSHFCGQELFLETGDGLDRLGRLRRLVRLAVDMSLNGPIATPRSFPGLYAEETIAMEPDAPQPGIAQRVRVRFVLP